MTHYNMTAKSNTKEFIEKARIKHGNTYSYYNAKYKTAFHKVLVTCQKHGDFLQRPNDHLMRHGCPECAKVETASHRVSNTKDFIMKAKKVHGERYNYEKTIYNRKHLKVTIVCQEHGEFYQTPNGHLNGKGCRICSKKGQSTIGILWLESLERVSGTHIQHAANGGEFRIPATPFRCDGYCKETNTVYEFYGDRWHGNPKIFKLNETPITFTGCYKTAAQLYETTLAREAKIRSLGYNLVTIWEADWKRQINTSTV